MITNYIKNFDDKNIKSVAKKLRVFAESEMPEWDGTIYIGSKPIYVKCYVKWAAQKIEKFFVKTLSNVQIENTPVLYILDKKINDILPNYNQSENSVYFVGDNIYTKPDMVIQDSNIFVHDDKDFYISVGTNDGNGFFYLGENHLLMKLFNYIFNPDENIVLHGAVVGYNDYGILITGLSGSGKSTLSAYCATLGMDFVSDDRVALHIDQEKTIAEPIYSTLSLLEPINGLKPKESVKSMHGNKDVLIMDKSQITSGIKICAVIEPVFANTDTPSIVPWARAPILTRICEDYSKFGLMARSMSVVQDYKNIFNLLKNADFFRINLSKSITENARAILKLTQTKKV